METSFPMSRPCTTRLCCALVILAGPALAGGDEPLWASLGSQYEREIRPLLDRFCAECHSTELKEGELDLERFAALADVRQDPGVWQNVQGMLAIGEMPPEDAEPLAAKQRTRLLDWLRNYLDVEARLRAGDPGPVVLRRLNNAEFTYTIHDLTGVELDPAREFPADGAAGEGFTNTGQTLAMSPALVRKYVDAGKEIASHAVLLPGGFRFSPHTSRRDRTDECLARIREYYRQFVDPVELGATYDNDMTELGRAGRLPLEEYLSATIALRDAPSAEPHTIEQLARKNGLSVRYLGTLWSFLSESGPAFLLDDLRTRWRSAQPQDAATIAGEIAVWQKALWTFGPIAMIGTETGPLRWMEPLQPLVTQHELTLNVPPPGEGEEQKEVVLSLVATDAGDGNEHDFVVWQRPRLVMDGQSDILLRDLRSAAGGSDAAERADSDDSQAPWGLDPDSFGKHPNGQPIDAESLCSQAPSAIAIRIPADLAAGRTFVTTAVLDSETGVEGTAQVELVSGAPPSKSGLQPIDVDTTYLVDERGHFDRRDVTFSRPILVGEKSTARQRIESSFASFRDVFPASLCYSQIVPVDEYHTIKLFYREDDHLVRLMLDEDEKAELDRLWEELHYVSQSAFLQLTALEMFLETQANGGGDYELFEPLLAPTTQQAEAFKEALIESERRQLDALLEFASRAYRRPLTEREADRLGVLYQKLRDHHTPHKKAFRLTLARIFASPEFLYRLEQRRPVVRSETDDVPARPAAHSVSDLELANRLSYFLWSSFPDEQLREAADQGRLTGEDAELQRQSRRMLQDSRMRRLAIQFACQWLHIRGFDQLEEKSRTHFPSFAALQEDMYEESIRFFTDLFQNDGSILDILQADHAFLNERLATHYGIPGMKNPGWQRVDGIREFSRGGILTQATILARQSGASRTNPILRGNFIYETLLGQQLPRPPKDVPDLPDDVPEGLTERALIEQHSSDEACAKCHVHIDPYGFALEEFDAIGRFREVDSHGHSIDTSTTLIDGTRIEGLDGLRNHLLNTRRDEFVRQFCRKLLGYGLGRGVQLSDEPLLDEMLERLATNDYRFSVAVEIIVMSDQFRMIRAQTQ
jgi:hypothetical protein